jgi:hypothetical protein
MTDSHSIQDSERERRIADLVLDGLHLDLHRAQLRIADLEADNRALRELLHLSLDRLRASTTRERRMVQRVRALTSTAHGLQRAA